MRLLVVRHTSPEEGSFTEGDKGPPISKNGREKFQQVCKSLDYMDLKFDLLLDSPLLRSQQTADIFCEYFPVKKRERSLNLKPLAEVSDLLLEIQAYNMNSVVTIGHQPFLARFINHCVAEDQKIFTLLDRAGMVFLEFPLAIQAGSAIIEALFQPKFFLKKG